MADIQNLKKIREIKTQYGFTKDYVTEIEKKILEKLNNPNHNLNKRIKGLEIEDEFYLLTLLMKNVEQITKLEQKQIINQKKYTVPDFLLSVVAPKELHSEKIPQAQRMFVEVKKCKEGENDFIITKKAYQKLKYYAELYSPIPLYFAIKFDNEISKQWFFISSKILVSFAKMETRKIINRNQECYVMSITELLKKDLSGLWFASHFCLINKETIVTKTYDKSMKEFQIYEENLGALTKLSINYKNNSVCEKIPKNNLPIETMVFFALLKRLARGKEEKKCQNNINIISFQADENYFIPYYHIILDSYLHIRQQFQNIQDECDNTIEFYSNNFSNIDKNIILYIKKVYSDLVNSKVIFPIKMNPNFEEKQN